MDSNFVIQAKGHKNILSTHKTTWELTKDNYLTKQGDCIIGVKASAAASSLPSWLKNHLLSGGGISIKLVVNNINWEGKGSGDPQMTLTHPTEMVFRKSSFISDRTVAINCDFAANEIPRKMIRLLQNPQNDLQVILGKLI